MHVWFSDGSFHCLFLNFAISLIDVRVYATVLQRYSLCH